MSNPFKDLADLWAKGETLRHQDPGKRGVVEGVQEPTSGCAQCDYTGWDKGEGKGYRRCECSRPSVEDLLRRAGVPPKERIYSEQWLNTHATHLKRRLEETHNEVGMGRPALLTGPPGRGKTGVAVLILRRMVQDSSIGYYYVPDLLARLRGFINSVGGDTPEGEIGSERVLYARLMAPQVLMLDDLGAEKPSEWVREQILRILRGRDSEDKPVIVTSNLELQDRKGTRAPSLAQYYGARIVSRLGAYKEIRFPPGMPDLRKEVHHDG